MHDYFSLNVNYILCPYRIKHLIDIFINLLLHYFFDSFSLRIVLLLTLGYLGDDLFYLKFYVFGFVFKIHMDEF